MMPTPPVKDKELIMKTLFDTAKAKGRINTKEILDAMGEVDFEPEQLEKFYDELEAAGIEIIEDFNEIKSDDLEFTQEMANEKAEIEPECGAQSHGYAQSHRDAPGSVGKP